MVEEKITNFAAKYRIMKFLGNIESKTDAKGRVFLPATFRKILELAGEKVLVLRKDFHQPCLVLYPMSAWNRRTDALLENVNEFDDESQMVFRMYVSEAEEVTLDGNGRLLIPRRYLQMADIKQAVRFIGINDTIEIWAAEKVEKPFLSQEDFSAKLKAMMANKRSKEE
jgi:MraZ protein